MSRDGFWRQAGIALLLSATGAVLHLASSPLLGPAIALRAVIVGLAAAYLGWLLHDSRARTGVLVSLVAWLFVSAGLCVLDPAIAAWLLVQSLMIWLLRSLHRHDTLMAAVADAVLGALAVAAALATAGTTHNLFLTLWSYFLVQAMFVFLPSSRMPLAAAASAIAPDDAFSQSCRTAEDALRRLSIRP
jgi:hypothetical protein